MALFSLSSQPVTSCLLASRKCCVDRLRPPPDRVGQRPPLRRVPAQPQSRAKPKGLAYKFARFWALPSSALRCGSPGVRRVSKGRSGAADEKLAVELYRRHVPLEQIERAYLLGCARKYVALLNRPGAALISSLHYLRSSVLCPPGSGRGLTCFGTAAVGRRHGLIIVFR